MNNGVKALAFTSIAHFANDGTAFMFPVLIVYYTALVPVTVLGSLAIIYEVISGLLSMRVGSMADAGDRDNSLIALGIGILAGSVVAFALSFAFRQYLYEFLLLGIVMLGIGQAFYHPLGATVLSQSFGRDRAPSALGLNGAIASSGRAVMPFILVSLFAIIGIGAGLGVIAIYMFAAALAIYFGLKFFHRKKSKPQVMDEPVSKPSRIDAYRGFLLVLTVIVFIRSMFMMGVTTFAPTYLTYVLNSKSLMSILLSVSLLTSVFGQPIFGYLTSLKGGKFTIAISSLFSVIGFFIFLFTKSFVIIFFGYALFTFMAFTGFPVLLGYVGQVVPSEFSTRSNSMVWGVGNTIGGAAGIAVYTIVYPYIGLADAMWIMLLFAIISGLMLPLLPSKDKKYETVT
ncbi:Major Facilitator Superfamily protein [Thermoplasmatales archaeon]|nr:Major Facilitator Superfamily protein [Thermoplasmatales archaeon]